MKAVINLDCDRPSGRSRIGTRADVDPEYYANNEDGDEPHGYWLKSPNWEWDERYYMACQEAINKKIACWIEDKYETPF